MIWMIAGTKDAREIIDELKTYNYKLLATTATEYGKKLIDEDDNTKVIAKRLQKSEIKNLIKNEGIKIVIDASHPYADEISKNALDVCIEKDVRYIRYERESIYDRDIQTNDILNFKSIQDACKYLYKKQGNILLTTGSKTLEIFTSLLDINKLFIRVLPNKNVVKKCEDIGFNPNQIIGMQGSFSKEFNKEMYKHFNIKYMVTKDSGEIGGVYQKINAAQELGVKPIIIKRPSILKDNKENSKTSVGSCGLFKIKKKSEILKLIKNT